MDTKESLRLIVDYIEDHLHDRLTVDDLALVGGFSKYHLNRLFSVYTGHSLMGYVRKRKLQQAVIDLQTGQRIIDIAATYAYSSERAFSRAFLREFGEPPSHFRNCTVLMMEKLTIYDLDLPFLKGAKTMPDYLSKVRYQTIEGMYVIRAIVISQEPENDVIGLLQKYAVEKGLKTTRNFGFDVPVSEEQGNEGLRGYEYWLVVNEVELKKVALPTLFEGVEVNSHFLKEHRYASLRIEEPFVDPFERIPTGWKALVKWIEEKEVHLDHQKYDNCQTYCLEEVIEKDGKMSMDIYIPVD